MQVSCRLHADAVALIRRTPLDCYECVRSRGLIAAAGGDRRQAERWLRDLDVVQREEFEAIKEMARLAREENEALKARIAALEARLGGTATAGP